MKALIKQIQYLPKETKKRVLFCSIFTGSIFAYLLLVPFKNSQVDYKAVAGLNLPKGKKAISIEVKNNSQFVVESIPAGGKIDIYARDKSNPYALLAQNVELLQVREKLDDGLHSYILTVIVKDIEAYRIIKYKDLELYVLAAAEGEKNDNNVDSFLDMDMEIIEEEGSFIEEQI